MGHLAFVLAATLAAFACSGAAAWECSNKPSKDGSKIAILALLGHDDDVAWTFKKSGAAGRIASLRKPSTVAERLERELKSQEAKHFSSTKDFLQDFRLHDVRLHPESPQGIAQETNLQYLLMLDVDRLIWSFRRTAGLATPGVPYGGWEQPRSELRGHFVGHYLSAAAFAWASTGNRTLEKQMRTVVQELAKCQESMGSGYLSAFPTEFIDRFEAVLPVWAPYYTIHKIMAGLLDQYVIAGNEEAFKMLLKMTNYFMYRVDKMIADYTVDRWWKALNEEFGGMNDLLYRLYAITGDDDHLRLAHLFDKPCFLGPLALQTDDLAGLHSNTHIPLVVGAQMRYEILGENIYKEIAEYFMVLVNTTHGFATGGTSSTEFWHDPHRQGTELGQEDQETCTSYNMLKVSRNLFRWGRSVSHMDYFERLVLNGILGVQRGTKPGVMIYMLPLGAGNSKAKGKKGWGDPFDTFWCCYGTGIESFAKLGDSIYFQEPGNPPGVYLVQFVSSTVRWEAAGLMVKQMVEQPSAIETRMNVTIQFSRLSSISSFVNVNETSRNARFERRRRLSLSPATVSVRLPGWATYPNASLNGKRVSVSSAGSFLKLQRNWSDGDYLQLTLPLTLHTEPIQDDRPSLSSLHAILFGPLVLVGLTNTASSLANGLDPSSPKEWLVPVPPLANRALVTFGVSLVSMETDEFLQDPSISTANRNIVLQHSDNGEIIASQIPREGTQEAMEATFRIIPAESFLTLTTGGLLKGRGSGCYASSSENVGREGHSEGLGHSGKIEFLDSDDVDAADWPTLIGRTIALEVFSQPGHYLVHNGVNQPITVTAELILPTAPCAQRKERFLGPWFPFPTLERFRKSVTNLPLKETLLPTARFTIRKGLDGSGKSVSFEASNKPGYFMALRKKTVFSPHYSLHLVELPAEPTSMVRSVYLNSFVFETGLASYNNISFAAPGSKNNFLMAPISAVRDEQYTTYFSFS